MPMYAPASSHLNPKSVIEPREPLRISLGQLLELKAEEFQNRPFLTEAETGKNLSFTEFNREVNRLAHGFVSLGITKDEYVGIMLVNSHEYLIASYALKKIGAIEVAINNTFKGVSLSRMLNLTKLTCMITEDKFLAALNDVAGDLLYLKQLIIHGDTYDASTYFPNYEVLSLDDVRVDDDRDCAIEIEDDQTATILFTSGTTGVSKGCAIPHRSSVRAAESMIEAFKLTKEDCVYSPYPLFHCGAAQYDVLPAMMVGARAIIRNGFSLRKFWPEVVKYKATWFMALGSVQQLLWASPVHPDELKHNLRFIWGTPLPVDHDAFEERFKVKLARGGGYGSTDAGSVALPLFDKAGAGKVLDRYEVIIANENDDPLPNGSVGELLIRPREPAIMASSYLGLPEETLKTWRNLWFHTGDLARLDDDGDLFWVARISERIRVKGEMVSAYEIEEVILSHPSVEDCAVLGAPDGIGEENIHPFITLRANCVLSLEDLQLFCKTRMSRFMLPSSMDILTEMPRTPSGKPAKADLKKLFESS